MNKHGGGVALVPWCFKASPVKETGCGKVLGLSFLRWRKEGRGCGLGWCGGLERIWEELVEGCVLYERKSIFNKKKKTNFNISNFKYQIFLQCILHNWKDLATSTLPSLCHPCLVLQRRWPLHLNKYASGFHMFFLWDFFTYFLLVLRYPWISTMCQTLL